MPDPKPPAPVPLGPSLDSTDEELDAAALTFTPEEIERSKIAAKRHGRGTIVPNLLDAEGE